MTSNARLIQKNIMVDVSTSGGDSEIIDLNGASKFSCQAIYDVSAPGPQDFTSPADIDVPGSTISLDATAFVTGLRVRLTTTDTLPAPLQLLTNYYVIKLDDATIQLATTLQNALDGVFIVLEDAGPDDTVNTVTPSALSGASVTFQMSNDGTHWDNIQSATSIAADGSAILRQPDVPYRYFKAVKALSAGVVDLQCLILVIGPAI